MFKTSSYANILAIMRADLLPLNIAHRGARKVAPENTLAAFGSAEQQGADGVELDVFRCLSGELVVTHDDDLGIWSNGRGRVTETPLSALKELDFGSHFSQQFAGEKIPLLQEVVDLLGEQMFINIELKTLSLRPVADAAAVAELIARNNLFSRVIVSSFNPLVLHHIKRVDPRIDTGLLFQFRFPLYLRRPISAPLLKLQAVHPEKSQVTQRYVKKSRQRGYLINTWTVNEPIEMRRLIELEVDGIITDYPDRLSAILKEYGRDYSLPPPAKRKRSRIGLQ
jgi:glycerophosphoryl diester phosphodiesterase